MSIWREEKETRNFNMSVFPSLNSSPTFNPFHPANISRYVITFIIQAY